jgi:transcription regulator MmyB-like protein/helix-turn-helix protein
VDNRAEVREFLIPRRAKVTPQQAGVPDIGARRVPGLRRGEVAALAGVSVEYYSKLERGAIAGVSASVLDAIARALQLDDAERAHLFHLAHAADGTSAGMRPRRSPWQTLDTQAEPAMGARQVHRSRHRPQRPHGPAGHQPPRSGHAHVALRGRGRRAAQLGPLHVPELHAARDFYPDWDGAADTCVAILRTEAGRDPHDKDLHDLVGELSTRSEDFRRRWSAHNVRYHGAGTKHFHHHAVGDLELAYESVDMIADPGLTLTLYAAEPASQTAHALDLLDCRRRRHGHPRCGDLIQPPVKGLGRSSVNH